MHPPALALVVALIIADTTSVDAVLGQHPLRAVEDTIVRPSQQFDVTRFDSATAVSLRAILDEAAGKGLPTTPLLNKALEGSARHAPGSKILATVRAHASAMEDARGILGMKATTAELDAAASAMRTGVDGGTLSQLQAARPGNAIVKPLVILTDLMLRGIPFATANNAVLTIARLSRSDDALDTMQSLVAKNAARGGPTMAVDALQRYLRETVAANGTRSPSGSIIREPDR